MKDERKVESLVAKYLDEALSCCRYDMLKYLNYKKENPDGSIDFDKMIDDQKQVEQNLIFLRMEYPFEKPLKLTQSK